MRVHDIRYGWPVQRCLRPSSHWDSPSFAQEFSQIAATVRVPVLGPSPNGAASGPRWLAAALLANVPL